MTQTTSQRPSWKVPTLICLALAAATILTFWPVTHCDFVDWDDQYFVAENNFVKPGLTLAGLKWAMSSVVCANWHPVTMISHMLDCQVFGMNAGMHHLTNLLIHTANVLLLFLLLRRLTGAVWRSAFVAAIFGLHPLRVESIAWVSERKDVLCVLFFLLTIWAYSAWTRKRTVGRYFVVLGLFALALMSKPMAVTLPFVLLLLDFWPLGRLRFGNDKDARTSKRSATTSRDTGLARLILEKLPMFALTAVLCVVTYLLQKQTGAIASNTNLPAGFRLTNPFISYWRYVGKLFWPAELSPMYLREQPWPVWLVAAALVGLIIVSVLAVRSAKARPYLVVGWLFYLGTLIPVIGFVQQGDQCMADRFTYIPSIGLLIAVTWGVWHVVPVKAKGVLAGVAILCMVACAGIAHRQCYFWQNTETLFNDMSVSNRNAIAYNALGLYYLRNNQPEKAETEFRQAIAVRPGYTDAINNLGVELAKQGKGTEAIAYLRATVQQNPTLMSGRINLAHALFDSGDASGAQQEYARAAQIDPRSFEAWHGLGICYEKQGDPASAVVNFGKALAIEPENAVANANMGRVLFALKRYADAYACYVKAVQAYPDNPDTQLQLGLLLAMQGQANDAEKHIEESLRLNPNGKEAKEALALIRKQRHQ